MTKKKSLSAGVAVLAATVLAAPRGSAGQTGPPPSEAVLISDVESIRPGTPFSLGVRITLRNGWHTYWANPGDSGMAPHLEWRMPEGFIAGPVCWPAPQRFDEPPILTFGYTNEVLLFREVHPPANLVTGRSYAVEVKASWLICKDACVPKHDALRLNLRAAAGAPIKSVRNQPLFARARERVPVTDPAWSFRAAAVPGALWLYVSPPPDIAADAMTKAVFFPAQPNVVKYGLPVWTWTGREYCLRLERGESAATLPDSVEGVLVVPPNGVRNTKALEVRVRLSPPEATASKNEHQVGKTTEGGTP